MQPNEPRGGVDGALQPKSSGIERFVRGGVVQHRLRVYPRTVGERGFAGDGAIEGNRDVEQIRDIAIQFRQLGQTVTSQEVTPPEIDPSDEATERCDAV